MRKKTVIKIILVADILMIVFLLSMFIRANAEYVNALEGLNIRSEPSTDAEVLDVLPFAEEVHGDVVGPWMKLADRSGYVKVAHLTAYDPLDEMTCLGEWKTTAYTHSGMPCANGQYPTAGYTIACNSLGFGSQVYIAGIGFRTVEDLGPTHMPDAWCDIFLDTGSECWNYGVQYRTVYLMEEVEDE